MLLKFYPNLCGHYNEPFADSSAIPTYYVANMTKDFVKVVLTGDAGDENFAGYRRYLRSQWVSLLTKVPEKIRKEIIPTWLKAFAVFHVKRSKIKSPGRFFGDVIYMTRQENYAEQIKIFNAKEKENIYTEDFHNEMEKIDPLDFLVNKI